MNLPTTDVERREQTPEAARTLLLGTLIGERYRVVGTLGSGGMGGGEMPEPRANGGSPSDARACAATAGVLVVVRVLDPVSSSSSSSGGSLASMAYVAHQRAVTAAWSALWLALMPACGSNGDADADAAASVDAGSGEPDAALAEAGACAAPTCAATDAAADAAHSTADSGAGGADAGLDCQNFPVFDRSCSTDADCALGQRTFNCCGSMLVTGVRADRLPAFQAAASQCSVGFPACGCPTEPTRADDGSRDDFSNGSLPEVSCVHGQCWSTFQTFTGKTPCGYQGLECDAETEVCRTRTPVGPATVEDCVPVPSSCAQARDCDCLSAELCPAGYSVCTEGTFANNITCTCPLCQ